MIATVTLNPTLDRTVTVEGLVLDEANRWTSLRRDPGGKGINVSRVVHELGGRTTAYGLIGGEDGDEVKHLLHQKGVPIDFTLIKEEIRSNFIITDIISHHQTRIDAPGPCISESELASFTDKICNIHPNPDYLVFAGSVPPGVPDDIYQRLIDDSNKKGIKTVLDCDEQWLINGLKAIPNVIKPNVYEAEELLNTKLKTEHEIVEAAKQLAGWGIEIVMISRGKDGLIAVHNNEVLKVVAPKVEVSSTVGAGDSTIAGLVLKLSQGGDFEEACRLAVASGAATALTPGTALCHRRDVEELLPQIKVHRLS